MLVSQRDNSRGPVFDLRSMVRMCIGRLGLGAQFGHDQPIVLVRLVSNPRRQRHTKITGQRFGIALIKRTQIAKPLVGVTVAADAYAALAEQIVKLFITLKWEPVWSIFTGGSENICARSTIAWRAMAKVN
jgi:hypothetical protein